MVWWLLANRLHASGDQTIFSFSSLPVRPVNMFSPTTPIPKRVSGDPHPILACEQRGLCLCTVFIWIYLKKEWKKITFFLFAYTSQVFFFFFFQIILTKGNHFVQKVLIFKMVNFPVSLTTCQIPMGSLVWASNSKWYLTSWEWDSAILQIWPSLKLASTVYIGFSYTGISPKMVID